MPLLARTVTAPVVIEVRRGAIRELAPSLADGRISAGGKVAIAVGPGQGDQLAEQLRLSLPEATVVPVESGSLEGAHSLLAALRSDYFDACVGIGGGRTLDAAKYAASMAGLPFVSVATTLTHDGIGSPVASLESGGRKASYGVQTPIAVFVDLDLVADAPRRHLRSGLGDVLSNLSSIEDWYLAAEVRDEPLDGLAITLARAAAEAVLHRDDDLWSDGSLTVLAEALILSGLAMSVAGTSRPCSGACHEISHALDASHGSPGLHGEQVAVGALFASWLRGDDELVAALDHAMLRHGLPRVPDDLGINADTFVRAVVEAPRTRPDRFTILEHLDLSVEEVRDRVAGFVAAFSR